jgi:hypothetical protein
MALCFVLFFVLPLQRCFLFLLFSRQDWEARVQELLAAQEQLTGKYRSETKSNLLHFEKVIRDSKAEKAQLLGRLQWYESSLQEATRQRDHARSLHSDVCQVCVFLCCGLLLLSSVILSIFF